MPCNYPSFCGSGMYFALTVRGVFDQSANAIAVIGSPACSRQVPVCG